MTKNESSATFEAQTKLIADLKSQLATKTKELKSVRESLQSERAKYAEVKGLLKETEENYRNVLENALNSILIVQDGMIRYSNPALAKLTGYSIAELLTYSFSVLIHPEDRQMVMDRHRRRLQGEEVEVEYSLRLVTKKKETIWGHVKAALTIFWQGRPATLVFLADITEKKATENALRVSEEQYHEFIEKMPYGFSHSRVVLDEKNQPVDFVFLDVNKSFLKPFKQEKKDIIGLSVASLIPDVEKILPDLTMVSERISMQGKSYQYEIYIKAFDKWFEVSTYSTQPGYFNTIYNDVTQKKRAEEASEKSKAFLEYSLNSAPDVILLFGPDYRFTFVNSAFTDLFGISESDVIGKTLLELAPEFLSEKEVAWINKSVKHQMQSGNSTSGFEIELNHRDGSVIPLFCSAAAIRDRKNRIIGEVVFLKDITERKRTQELMIQTEKMMSVGGLAAGMAHEINNPLGGMLQGAQNIIRRLSPDLEANRKVARESGVDLVRLSKYIKGRKIDEMLAGILSSGQRAARIITNMLQFSRQSESKLCPNNINHLIDEVLELSGNEYDLVKKYDFRKIEIIREYGDNLPNVLCTKSEIEQVILNLIKNAVQAMMETAGDKVPRLVIRTRMEDQMVCFEVEDNGPGLNPDVQKRIFEPFFTTKPLGMGTGLGLSVSYMIITNNHKGSMEVYSEPGHGARFIVCLPFQNKS